MSEKPDAPSLRRLLRKRADWRSGCPQPEDELAPASRVPSFASPDFVAQQSQPLATDTAAMVSKKARCALQICGNLADGSFADMDCHEIHVRDSFKNGRAATMPSGPPSANKRHSRGYSITSSARASKVGGISRPSFLAVLRLITRRNLVTSWTGRSAGLPPFKIWSTNVAASRYTCTGSAE